jgi:F-type H+-transporting ATPase subunit epsilon
MQFDLVSPERKVVSVEATSVQIPGMDGDFTAMPNHAPFLTTLRPGVVRVKAGSEVTEYVVTGGFAEVSPTAATILAEQAMERTEVSSDVIAELLKAAKAAATDLSGEERVVADTRVRDIGQLRNILRL